MKQAALRTAKAAGLFALARRALRGHLRILAYHGIWTTPGFQFGNRLFVPPELFERRMTRLKRSGLPVLPLDHAIGELARGSLPANAVVITIDDGWQSTYTHMLPVLESLRLPATVYVTTWYVTHREPVLNVALNYVIQRAPAPRLIWDDPVSGRLEVELGGAAERERVAELVNDRFDLLPSFADRVRELKAVCRAAEVPTDPWWENGQFHLMTPDEIKDAHARGLDIQLHTHRHRNLRRRDSELDAELADNRRVLSQSCPADRLAHFCYPTGAVEPAAIPVLARCGVRSAATCESGLNPPAADPYALRRFLDGRSVSEVEFDAYLSGALEILERMRTALPGAARAARA